MISGKMASFHGYLLNFTILTTLEKGYILPFSLWHQFYVHSCLSNSESSTSGASSRALESDSTGSPSQASDNNSLSLRFIFYLLSRKRR